MRKLITIILVLAASVAFGQTTYQLNYDSIRVGKTAGTGATSLYGKTYLKNATEGTPSDSVLTVRNGRVYKIAGSAISSVGFLTYVFSRTDSDISGYEQMPALTSYTVGSADTAILSATTTPAVIQEFATNTGFPNTTLIPAGVFNVSYQTQKSSGSQSYYTYAVIYKRSLAGSETVIATTANSTSTSSNTVQSVSVSAIVSNDISLLTTDRIIVKVFGVMVTGTANISLFYDDATDAKLQFPSALVDATNFVPYNGAVKDLVSNYSITGDSIKRVGGTGAQFLMGNGTVQDTTAIQTVANFFPKGDTRYLRSSQLGTSSISLGGTANGLSYSNGNYRLHKVTGTTGGVFTTGTDTISGNKRFNNNISVLGNSTFGTGATSVFDGSDGRLILDKLRVYNTIPATNYHDISSSASTNRILTIPDLTLTLAGFSITPTNGNLIKWSGTSGLLVDAAAGTDYLTPSSLTATSPIFYNSTTKVISSQAASNTLEGYVTTGTQTFSGNKQFNGTITFGTGATTSIDGSNGRIILDKLRVYNSVPATQYHEIVSSATSNYTITFPDYSITGATGTGAFALSNSPTFVNPVLGNASATAINVSGNGVPITSNSTNSNTYKLHFQDNGVARSYLGSNATNALEIANGSVTQVATINGTTGAYTATSDSTFKKNIADSQRALPILNQIKVRQYNWKQTNSFEPFGVIAQELYEVTPTYVSKPENIDGKWGVSKAELVPMLIKAIQELEARLLIAEEKIQLLENK